MHTSDVSDSHLLVSHDVMPTRICALELNKPISLPYTVILIDPVDGPLPLVKEDNDGPSYDSDSVSIALLLAPIVIAPVTEMPIFEVALHLRDESDTQSVISQVVPSRLAAWVNELSPKRLPTIVTTRDAAAGRLDVAFSLL